MKKDEIIRQFNNNELQHSKIMEKIELFGEKIEELKISIAEMPEKMTEKFDNRYASKETEESLKKIMWIVISAIIVALLALVLKK